VCVEGGREKERRKKKERVSARARRRRERERSDDAGKKKKEQQQQLQRNSPILFRLRASALDSSAASASCLFESRVLEKTV